MILGIELGSTRIKSVIIDNAGSVIATGAYPWENRLEKGFWTYSVEEIWHGLQESYADLKRKYESRFSKKLTQFDAIGISAMMHGYLAFDENDELLVPFRTWRNTNTGEAAEILSNELNFNMPLRWSASHLLQAVINREEHIHKICYITTLAGYVHYKLTGEKVLGIGDASGMFPIKNGEYDPDRIEKFESVLRKYGFEKSAQCTEITELTPAIVNRLIQRIEVHKSEKINGRKRVRLDVCFTAVGLINIPDEKELFEMMQEIQSAKSA